MKKIAAFLLAVLMTLSLAACGGESDNANRSQDVQSQTTADIPTSSDSDADTTVDIVFGNHPNNLLQSMDTLCFAEGRVFYVRANGTLCSFLLDGTDHKDHGDIGETKTAKLSSQQVCLNYYQGGIYFAVKANPANTTETLDIRRFNLSDGTFETVHTITTDSGRVYLETMLIINDTLCCAYGSIEDVVVCVLDLNTGSANTIAKGKSKGGNTNFGFDTDGKYLYMLWSGSATYAGMKRVLLTDLFAENPNVEKVFDRPYYPESYVLDDGGLYAVVRDNQTEEAIYGFYNYATLTNAQSFERYYSVEWRDYPETEQEYIEKLAIDTITLDYILSGARISVKEVNDGGTDLYYSGSLDWRQSTKIAKIPHATNTRRNFHVGEYNDTLYFVAEAQDGSVSLHSISADGNYQ